MSVQRILKLIFFAVIGHLIANGEFLFPETFQSGQAETDPMSEVNQNLSEHGFLYVISQKTLELKQTHNSKITSSKIQKKNRNKILAIDLKDPASHIAHEREGGEETDTGKKKKRNEKSQNKESRKKLEKLKLNNKKDYIEYPKHKIQFA